MKIKNGNIEAGFMWVQELSTADSSVPFAFHVSAVLTKLTDAMKLIDPMKEKIRSYGLEKDAEGNPVFMGANKQYAALNPAGQKDMGDLMSCEQDLDLEQFTKDELQTNGVKIKAINLQVMGWLIK
jgi:hypothetical protein